MRSAPPARWCRTGWSHAFELEEGVLKAFGKMAKQKKQRQALPQD